MYLKPRRSRMVKHCKTIEKQIQIAWFILMGYHPRINFVFVIAVAFYDVA